MSLQLYALTNDQDWSDLARILFTCPETPYQSFFQRLHPIANTKSDAQLLNATQSLKAECLSDPTSHALKVVDLCSGRMVGGLLSNIYTVRQAQWDLRSGPTETPHVFLRAIATDPTYAQDHVAEMCLGWGVTKAQSLGIELCLYSTSPDMKLCKAKGLECVGQKAIRPDESRAFFPFNVYVLRRLPANNRELYKRHYTDTQGFW